ncbi:MAG: VCBS repeat-containing protein, partial [Saprospiraceae bacterium]|nr:VCBS repeat-containing protein [Saprospiraceae bacterium]
MYLRIASIAFWASVLLIHLALLVSCNPNGNIHTSEDMAKGHRRMLQILEETRIKINVPGNNFAALAKIKQCDSIISHTNDPNVMLSTMVTKAIYWLEYGDEKKAVEMLEDATKTLASSAEGLKVVLPYLGTAYLRLAERTNCVNGHSADACIMPIKGKGIHQEKEPARKAVETFERLLQLEPKQYDAIWLLNIAYMTLGQYPEKVPSKWLIPRLDKEDYIIKPFIECASALKIQVNNRAGGSIADDFDNDGLIDLITSAWDLEDPVHYFRNNGDGTFSDWSEQSGLKAIKGGLNILQTDYNNDGFLDILVLRGAWQGQEGPSGDQPNSLLRNNGDGTFTDVTIEAGLLSFNPTQTATWNDFNRDGWVDLFIGNESMNPNDPRKCEFYINNGDGTFKNVADEWGIAISIFVKGVTSGDFDNDGWPDLFLSCMDGNKILLRNNGVKDGKIEFQNATQSAGFDKETYRSFATWFFDYDNDGWLDLFVCNYEFGQALSYYAAKEILEPSNDSAGKAFVYHNNGNGTFTNTSSSIELKGVAFAMGANFGDIN